MEDPAHWLEVFVQGAVELLLAGVCIFSSLYFYFLRLLELDWESKVKLLSVRKWLL